ncbi:hypothetical protein [Stieleria varia]|uniref:Uncharacterized protein n=1 Tax=Stieleria varia TaxID=2528005 RepID=A0A5C6ANX2_9BACT|nr:hypothetical protein [Stieleria varia]TWU00959.1 hypothetical protein Pla52n_43290 [Stieleria varia]
MKKTQKATEPTICDPTPEQIRKRSQEVRSRWSKRVRASRRCLPAPVWMPPTIAVTEVVIDNT